MSEHNPYGIDVQAIRARAQAMLEVTARLSPGVCTTAGWEATASDEQIIREYRIRQQTEKAFRRGCACGAPASLVYGDGTAVCRNCMQRESDRREAAYYGGLHNFPFRQKSWWSRLKHLLIG